MSEYTAIDEMCIYTPTGQIAQQSAIEVLYCRPHTQVS